jgi:hypothetical protein
MKPSLLIFACLGLLAKPLPADTIYQTTAQGKQLSIQQDAIVIQEDSSFLVYKHFDLKERRVTKVRLNKGSLPYYAQTSDAQGRAQILEKWKRVGFKAVLTDQAGRITHLFDLYLDFYPPGGHGSLLESVPPRTSLPVLLDNGGADEIDFFKIDRVSIQGDRLSITLQEGKTLEGKFLMPTTHPAEARILGITDHYDPASPEVFDFSIPLSKLKLITFE